LIVLCLLNMLCTLLQYGVIQKFRTSDLNIFLFDVMSSSKLSALTVEAGSWNRSW